MDLSDVEELVVGCLTERHPFVGGWVQVTAGMEKKNPLRSLHGPADAEGTVRIRGQDLMYWADLSLGLALMDYGNPGTDWTGELTVEPVGLVSAAKAIHALNTWGTSGRFPVEYEDGLVALVDRLHGLRAQRLAVKVLNVRPQATFVVTAPGAPRPVAEC